MKRLLGAIALVWPAQCAGCGEVVEEGQAWCAGCVHGIDPVGPGCARCGEPAERPISTCARCARAAPPLASAHAYGLYGGPLGDAILRLKHGRKLEVARVLGRLLGEVARPACDVIVPVPLHPKRLQRRGFDQAAELARAMRAEPVVRALERVRDTPPQSGGPTERLANVRGAFTVPAARAVAGRRVLLVDDVLTTGATAAACARALRDAGASIVHCLTVARAAA